MMENGIYNLKQTLGVRVQSFHKSPQEQVIFKVPVVVNKVTGLVITALDKYSPKVLLQKLQSIFTWTERVYWGMHIHTDMSYTYRYIPHLHGTFRSGQSEGRQVKCKCANVSYEHGYEKKSCVCHSREPAWPVIIILTHSQTQKMSCSADGER